MTYPLLLLMCAALFSAIAWRDARNGLFVLCAALPAYLLRFQLGGIPLTLLEAFVLIFVGIWIWKNGRTVGARDLVPAGWTLPIGLLLAAATIGIVVAPDRMAALGAWKAYFIEPVMLFLVVRLENKRIQGTKAGGEIHDAIFDGLATGALVVAAVAIAQKATGWGVPAPWDVEGRVTSVFPYPNAVGLYLGPVIVIGIGKSFGRLVATSLSHRFFWMVTTGTAILAIVFSESEAAWVAVGATLFVAAFLTKRLRAPALLFALFCLLSLSALPSLRGTVLDKLTFNDYSGHVRRSQWEETVEMLKDRPILGAGLAGYPSALIPYHTHPEYEIFQYPHQIFLNVWSELGLLGLLALSLLAVQTIKTIRKPRDSSLLSLLALLQMSVHGLADVPYFKNDLAITTWLLLAVAASASLCDDPSDPARTSPRVPASS